MSFPPSQDPTPPDSTPPQGGGDEPVQRLIPDEAPTRPDRDLAFDLNALEQTPAAQPEAFEENGAGVTKGHQILWLGLSSLLVIGLIVALVMYLRLHQEEDQNLTTPDKGAETSSVSSQDSEAIRKEITRVVIGYAEAEDIERRARFSRRVPNLEKKMLRYYRSHPFKRAQIVKESVLVRRSFLVDKTLIYTVWAQDKFGQALIFPVCESANGLLVDWEAAAVWQPVAWETLNSGEIQSPTRMRVQVQLNDFFIAPYDPESHLCFKIQSPGLEQAAYGFVLRDSPTHKKLRQAIRYLQNEDEPLDLIFELRFQQRISDSVFFDVTGVEAFSWVQPLD